ncbi:hypothetical protein HZI73_08255 [Vallitalea pronyensis]|uniref:Cytochrome C biogenesis protein transmembrane domain-containing protein n=1 Tax=Vallitalea pronyensis TaxID=1348613 RepID=A0A8J8SGD9_9FIRM|nr:hypothetical protein [Vallitalea pronyensis]QUI22289.1 hypothetical protein HZI73_08255 [Vallitalea pronyensis]
MLKRTQNQKIRLHALNITLVIIFLLSSTTVMGKDRIVSMEDVPGESIDFVYFYVNLCENCTEAKEQINRFMNQIEAADLQITINFMRHNISYYEGSAYDTYLAYLEHYGLKPEETSTPILFVGDTYYKGEKDIQSGLDVLLSEIRSGLRPTTPILTSIRTKNEQMKDTFDGFNLLKMFVIGIVNGLNPCSLSMLLLLLSLLLVKNISLVKCGLTFISGKFIAFILLGTLLFQNLSKLNQSYLFYTKLAISSFIILLAVFNIYDFYMSKWERYGKIKNQLPSGLRRLNHIIIEKLSSPTRQWLLYISLFALGIILAISEFLCTGQIYLITINYMIKTTSELSLLAVSYLVIYALGFIIPPTLVILIIVKTNELFNITEFIRKKMPYIKLITAITLIILGVLTLFL